MGDLAAEALLGAVQSMAEMQSQTASVSSTAGLDSTSLCWDTSNAGGKAPASRAELAERVHSTAVEYFLRKGT